MPSEISFPISLGDFYKMLQSRIGNDVVVRRFIAHYTGYDYSDLIASSELIIDEAMGANMFGPLKRLVNGEPLSRIIEEREFWGLSFSLSSNTLDPRPDTEVLIEAALKHYGAHPPKTLIDFGTGSGCILIALLTEWPETYAVGVDLSLQALQTAKKNAQRHNVHDRVHWVCGDWDNAFSEAWFDCIVSNPPYIKADEISNLSKSVRNFDPIQALDGGEDGLVPYKKLFSTLPSLLNKGGRAFFEIGFDQKNDMMRLGKKYGIRIERIIDDYAGNPRVVDISCGDK